MYQTIRQAAMAAALKDLSVTLLKSDSKILPTGFLSDHEAERWPEDLQGLCAELVTALKALPEDTPQEMVKAVLEPVQEYPALMLAMPCQLSVGQVKSCSGLERQWRNRYSNMVSTCVGLGTQLWRRL